MNFTGETVYFDRYHRRCPSFFFVSWIAYLCGKFWKSLKCRWKVGGSSGGGSKNCDFLHVLIKKWKRRWKQRFCKKADTMRKVEKWSISRGKLHFLTDTIVVVRLFLLLFESHICVVNCKNFWSADEKLGGQVGGRFKGKQFQNMCFQLWCAFRGSSWGVGGKTRVASALGNCFFQLSS